MKNWFRVDRFAVTHKRVLFGADGLRPGWRVLVFFLVFAGLVICTLPLFKHLPRIHSPSGMLPWPAALSESVLVALVLLATAALARFVDRRPWGVDGMPLKRAFGGKFWIGVLIGIGTLTAQLLVMRAVGVFEFGTLELHGYEALRSAAAWAVFSVLTAIFEQLLLRGYAQRALTDAIGFWPAALALSCLFAALHLVNAGENKFGIIAVVLVGMFYCFTLARTGDLWLAIGFHASWDWAETFLYGVPTSGNVAAGHLLTPRIHGSTLLSGGTAGPEGSVFALFALGLATATTAALYRRQNEKPK